MGSEDPQDEVVRSSSTGVACSLKQSSAWPQRSWFGAKGRACRFPLSSGCSENLVMPCDPVLSLINCKVPRPARSPLVNFLAPWSVYRTAGSFPFQYPPHESFFSHQARQVCRPYTCSVISPAYCSTLIGFQQSRASGVDAASRRPCMKPQGLVQDFRNIQVVQGEIVDGDRMRIL